MIRLDTDEVKQIIDEDEKIAAYFQKLLSKKLEKRESCYQQYVEQCELMSTLEQKEAFYREEKNKLTDIENGYHREISFLELQRVFLERQRKKAVKELHRPNIREERKAKLLADIDHYQEEAHKVTEKQDHYRDLIKENHSHYEEIQSQAIKVHDKMDRVKRNCEKKKNNVCEWDLSIEKEKTTFYDRVFLETQDNSKLLQEIVVRNLQKKKNSEEEALVKTDAILIGEDQISIDPPGKTRRLTKEEKEKYASIEKE